MNLLLHYENLSEFKKQFYKNLLTVEHLQSAEIKLDKLSFPDGDTDDKSNFWGHVFEKNGVKYLVPTKNSDGSWIHLGEVLPINATEYRKVAHRGVSYRLITKIQPMRPLPQKLMSFKQLVDTLSAFNHDNPKHQKLFWLIGITQMMDRAYFRISTPAGFGKDSCVDILGHLIGGSATIISPTIAKLEYMTISKWLAVNEVVDIGKAEWRIIEQFLLDAGAFKPEIVKHSRAIASGTKETMNISNFSMSLLYNDIDHYVGIEGYFDSITKQAVKDRFPALRLYGTYKEDFNEIKNINISDFVKGHFQDYRNLISTFAYFKENLHKEGHSYEFPKFSKIPERWKTNLNKLLHVIDLYSESQEEFNIWVNVLRDALTDYEEMLRYPELVEKASKKMSESKFKELMEKVNHQKTFKGRNELLEDKEIPIEDTSFWGIK